MSYMDIVCHSCNTKQMRFVGPDALELKCSACAKMISVPVLVEKLELEIQREEANQKQAEEQARLAQEEQLQPKPKKKGRKKNAK